MRRQSRGAARGRQVATLAIAFDPVVQEGRELARRRGFAGLPVAGHALVPRYPRHQLQLLERRRRGPVPWRWQGRGRGQRLRCRAGGRHVLPERREDLEGPAAFVPDIPGLDEQRRVEAACVDGVGAQSLLDPAIARDQLRLVAAAPEHRPCAGFLQQFAQRGQTVRGYSPQDQPRTALLQVRAQRLQRLVQPPARGGSGRPFSLVPGGPEEDGNDGRAALHGGAQRRMVGEAEVLPQPEQYGRDHRTCSAITRATASMTAVRGLLRRQIAPMRRVGAGLAKGRSVRPLGDA